MTVARVLMWGNDIGAVSQENTNESAVFQYTPAFVKSGIEVAPLTMPLRDAPYTFPALPAQSFHRLPGLLADSLPDKFGTAVIDAWLARQGRTPDSMNAVERLRYTGSRGLGALEYAPANGPKQKTSRAVNVDSLVQLAGEVLQQRERFATTLNSQPSADGLRDILSIGTSAGGARAKAIIAWNPTTNEVRSGQVKADAGFEYWLIKFDGVIENKDKELVDPKCHTAIEYAYHLMAVAAGINMSECRLLEENGRRHFMTKRFDRTDTGGKWHMQSLGALMHWNFNVAGAYSYEGALLAMRQLGLGLDAQAQLFRRAVFNVIARNQDDHVKNIAFLMDQQGQWTLSPAFDVTYSYNPEGLWTHQHQMQIGGKRDGFTIRDLLTLGDVLQHGRAREVVDEVTAAIRRWPEFAEQAGIHNVLVTQIAKSHRLLITT